jgi:hypothetical protein
MYLDSKVQREPTDVTSSHLKIKGSRCFAAKKAGNLTSPTAITTLAR